MTLHHVLLSGLGPGGLGLVWTPPVDGGRSTLLRAGIVSAPRRRRFVARWIAVGILAGLVVTFVLAVALHRFDAVGIGFVIYWLHDHLWLPLLGRFWTAPFPAGLAWLVPTVLAFALIAVEFLGMWSPLRRAQVAALRTLVLWGPEWIVLWSDDLLGALGLRAGLLRVVVAELRDTARANVIGTLEASKPADVKGLLRLEATLLYLDRATLQAVASGLEAVALTQLANAQHAPGIVRLVARLGAAGEGVRQCVDRISAETSVTESLQLTQALSLGPTEPMLPAVATLAIALAANRDAKVEHLQWFTTWARLRPGTSQTIMMQAEGLIAFEFWAALAENAVASPAKAGLLDEAFGARVLAPRPYGEVFARFGEDRKA